MFQVTVEDATSAVFTLLLMILNTPGLWAVFATQSASFDTVLWYCKLT